ncbi:MAG: hypothetical protein AAFN92_16990, partial [Bacteroidota bacterium]
MRYLLYLGIIIFLLTTGMTLNETLTRADVHVAAKVLGVDFLDDEEVDLMLPDLEDSRETLLELGQVEIPNEVSPALVFDPVLRAEQLPAIKTVSAPAAPPSFITVPNGQMDLQWATVEQLATMIYQKTVSCR